MSTISPLESWSDWTESDWRQVRATLIDWNRRGRPEDHLVNLSMTPDPEPSLIFALVATARLGALVLTLPLPLATLDALETILNTLRQQLPPQQRHA